MNKQLQSFARESLKEDLAKLSEKNRDLFKRIYSHDNMAANIDDVVDNMPEDKLDWAMKQVERTFYKMNKNKEKTQ